MKVKVKKLEELSKVEMSVVFTKEEYVNTFMDLIEKHLR